MSKFCTKCGRPIPEGGICPCQLPAGNQLNGRQASAQQGQQHKQPNSRQASAQQSHPHVQPNAGQPSAGQQGHSTASSTKASHLTANTKASHSTASSISSKPLLLPKISLEGY